MDIKLLLVFVFALSTRVYGQPMIPEDRMFLKVSPDVVKLEQDIYHPTFPGKEPTHFIRWVYSYSQGLLVVERAFSAQDLGIAQTEKIFEYNAEGRLIKDSTIHSSLPQLNSCTTYEYDAKGMLIKATERNTTSIEVHRVDTYLKYKHRTTYEKTSQFFGDNGKTTVKYTSIYKNGLKQLVYSNGFAPVQYEYDSTGNLIARNARQYFYKLDNAGNANATVQIERGFRIYNFIRITYVDGTVTGSLEPDKDFIQEWDNQK